MFGRSRPVTFDPYARRRGRRVPRWLLLLASGIAIGAAAIVVAEERWLPPRLSAEASARLQTSYEHADAERSRLARELDATAGRLQAAVAQRDALTKELAAARAANAELRADVDALVDALPPDPRGGAVAVRAARFSQQGTGLSYDVVLSRERAGSKPLGGVMQLLVDGAPARGPERRVALEPVPVSVGRYDSVRGTAALPEGFHPRQTTVQVLDRIGGKLLGMRIMNLK
ncbi:MAG TPA: hypothetical protein VMU47_24940 [Caldimonas sp.]|nr:hypothetical protein [Caldimonas sp.]